MAPHRIFGLTFDPIEDIDTRAPFVWFFSKTRENDAFFWENVLHFFFSRLADSCQMPIDTLPSMTQSMRASRSSFSSSNGHEEVHFHSVASISNGDDYDMFIGWRICIMKHRVL
ncbi:hypothetical protein V6Z12_A01G068900 [Gossypium hirsutum]